MSFEVKFSVKAEETFEAVVDQLEQRWDEKFVNKFNKKVLDCLDIISTTPFIYPIAKENGTLRKCVLHKNCSMFYTIHGNYVEIDFFWDNRQDPIVTS
ncbi:type II toxin-antitoxin system RelE/ParE family toxin [Mucilaginibacter sp. E4BP6]|jgi:plasmid stabilization system protein ParE|uniref:type II toxin-antitoxin system RelE/ParE family toxin n=1 Tax=Mucilaginibacter sp. E4BP6 TaxID=2723089 RepID=UPI0015C9A4FB|nr:type II toxin-antitoxin system RelE/ParE family toxin [Mucilaginibacter sp. E4BP6]NYE65665.1 plasmid stabilization system protein ParE [Mucilaginibacter sp. E4BP6]